MSNKNQQKFRSDRLHEMAALCRDLPMTYSRIAAHLGITKDAAIEAVKLGYRKREDDKNLDTPHD